MPEYLRKSTGKRLLLPTAALLGSGPGATVYAVPDEPWLVARVLDGDQQSLARKLAAMVARPPRQPETPWEGHQPITWPVDLLLDPDEPERVTGCLLPRVEYAFPLRRCAPSHPEADGIPAFDFRERHRAAEGLAAAVAALHESDVVAASLHDTNVLLREGGQVLLVDTFCYQIRDPATGEVYLGQGARPEYTAPEYQGRSGAGEAWSREQDRFGLAVLLFQLLMNGVHPFAGLPRDRTPARREQWVSFGCFPYADAGSSCDPAPGAPPYQNLHPRLRELFELAFVAGYGEASLRPTGSEWRLALREARELLIHCSADPRHWYGAHQEGCPWCPPMPPGPQPVPAPVVVEAPRPAIVPPVAAVPAPYSAPVLPPMERMAPLSAPPRRTSPVLPVATLGIMAGTFLGAGLVMVFAMNAMQRPKAPEARPAQPAPAPTPRPARPVPSIDIPTPPEERGFLAVQVPEGALGSQLRVRVLQDGHAARTLNGEALEGISAGSLGGKSLPPGMYTVQFVYRGKALPEMHVEVVNGRRTRVRPPRGALAEAEYAAAEAADVNGDGTSGYARTLRLDPQHVNAHLQLAAAAAERGDLSTAERHLAAAERLEPGNPSAAEVRQVLAEMKE